MRPPVRRKRYVLLTADGEVGPEAQRELLRVILERYPVLDRKKTVWVENSLIIRTDQLTLPEIRENLAISAGGVSLTPRLSSGSISKLKRVAQRR